ncbi:MAG: DNA-binding domain-containing protein [Luteolibacter sp.]|uniref:HU family DNA-binding protein n=1 Tax=Luteolibacter sp. TaxID=1962973 RepID=UPI003266F780
MAIKYSLIENLLTPDPNDYYAQIQLTGRAGKEELANRMLSLGSTVTKADLLAVITLMDEAVEALVLEGYRVDLAGIVDIYPRLQGVFNGPGDGFERSRHTLGVTANPSPGFISRIRKDARVSKEETVKPMPNPLDFRDAATGNSNGTITLGNIGTLSGSRLKFDPSAHDEGVFFISSTGGASTKVVTVSANKPGQLVFLNPAGLASGEYSLQVRSRLRDSAEIRFGTLDSVLSVP